MSVVMGCTGDMTSPEQLRDLAAYLEENPDVAVTDAINHLVEFGPWDDWRTGWQVLEEVAGSDALAEVMAVAVAEAGSYIDASDRKIGDGPVPSVRLDGEQFPARESVEKALDRYITSQSTVAVDEFDHHRSAKNLITATRAALDDPDFPIWEVSASWNFSPFGDPTIRNLLVSCRMHAALPHDMQAEELAENLIRDELSPADRALPVLLHNDESLFRKVTVEAIDAVLERRFPGYDIG